MNFDCKTHFLYKKYYTIFIICCKRLNTKDAAFGPELRLKKDT